MTDSPASPAGPTTFFIFETRDGGTLWRFVTTLQARDRDHALRLHYGDEVDAEVTAAAVSAFAWKPQTIVPKVVKRTERTEFAMPTGRAEEYVPPVAASGGIIVQTPGQQPVAQNAAA